VSLVPGEGKIAEPLVNSSEAILTLAIKSKLNLLLFSYIVFRSICRSHSMEQLRMNKARKVIEVVSLC